MEGDELGERYSRRVSVRLTHVKANRRQQSADISSFRVKISHWKASNGKRNQMVDGSGLYRVIFLVKGITHFILTRHTGTAVAKAALNGTPWGTTESQGTWRALGKMDPWLGSFVAFQEVGESLHLLLASLENNIDTAGGQGWCLTTAAAKAKRVYRWGWGVGGYLPVIFPFLPGCFAWPVWRKRSDCCAQINGTPSFVLFFCWMWFLTYIKASIILIIRKCHPGSYSRARTCS